MLVEVEHTEIPIARQCQLLGLPRSTFYYRPIVESSENLSIMELIDRQYLETPFYGRRRFAAWLGVEHGLNVSPKRVRRLMQLMSLEPIYCRPKTSLANKTHKVYPYLLRGLRIERPNQVWCTDITYIKLQGGFLYLVAIVDWHSRYVLSWELSNSLDAEFCVTALEKALKQATPEICNSDQGCQFTSEAFTGVLRSNGVAISMDGKGRCIDNVICERLWRTVKYEEVYIRGYSTGLEAHQCLARYFDFYNNRRVHQSLGYATPAAVYTGERRLCLN